MEKLLLAILEPLIKKLALRIIQAVMDKLEKRGVVVEPPILMEILKEVEELANEAKPTKANKKQTIQQLETKTNGKD